jgi:hypothetical protein
LLKNSAAFTTEEVRVRALAYGLLSAAVAAIKEKVLSGQRMKRREVGGPGEFDAPSHGLTVQTVLGNAEHFRKLAR